MASSESDWVMVTISPSLIRVLMSSPALISRASPRSLTLAPLLTLTGVSVPGGAFFLSRRLVGFGDRPATPVTRPALAALAARLRVDDDPSRAGLSSPRRTREGAATPRCLRPAAVSSAGAGRGCGRRIGPHGGARSASRLRCRSGAPAGGRAPAGLAAGRSPGRGGRLSRAAPTVPAAGARLCRRPSAVPCRPALVARAALRSRPAWAGMQAVLPLAVHTFPEGLTPLRSGTPGPDHGGHVVQTQVPTARPAHRRAAACAGESRAAERQTRVSAPAAGCASSAAGRAGGASLEAGAGAVSTDGRCGGRGCLCGRRPSSSGPASQPAIPVAAFAALGAGFAAGASLAAFAALGAGFAAGAAARGASAAASASPPPRPRAAFGGRCRTAWQRCFFAVAGASSAIDVGLLDAGEDALDLQASGPQAVQPSPGWSVPRSFAIS